MSGLDKIIERIAGESAAEAESILSDARGKAQTIASDSSERASEECAQIARRAEESVAAILERGDASADLRTKQILLQAKQEVLSETLDQARARLSGLSDEEYRDCFLRLFDAHVSAGEATLLINASDRARLSDGTLDRVVAIAGEKGCKLSVSGVDAPIKNGFILDYGGIEENCTFDALFDQNIDELTDLVGSVLFA